MNNKPTSSASVAPRRTVAASATLVVTVLAVFCAAPVHAAYQVITVTNGGTIDGMVSLAGDVPESRDIKITKNQDFCGNSMPDPTFKVAPGGGLENVIVYLKDVSKGKAPTIEPVKLVNEDCKISPRVQGAMVGTQVEISSHDPILHNVHAQNAETNATINNVALPFAGVSMTKALPPISGLIKIKSDAQEWMHAWIMELDHPYYATTGEGGRFTIKDVPAGTYTLVAWHEAAGESSSPIVVDAGQRAEANLTISAR